MAGAGGDIFGGDSAVDIGTCLFGWGYAGDVATIDRRKLSSIFSVIIRARIGRDESLFQRLVGFKVQASLANNLMDYKNRGHQVELLGQEDVEGVNTNKIKLTSKGDGKITTYFISTSTNLLVKSVSKREVAGNEYDAHTFYSDIKEVNGLKFSMHFVQKIANQVLQDVKYEKIELNVPIDEKIFVMPK